MSGGLRGYKASGLKYMSNKLRVQLLTELMRKNDIDEAQIEFTIKEFNKYPANTSAYRLVRILSLGHKDCIQLIGQYAGNIKPTHMLMLTPKDPASIRVFTNINLDMPLDYMRLENASAHTYPEVISSLTAKIESDMESLAAKVGWERLDRARTRLKKYVDMPIYQALTKYTNIKTLLGWNEAELKNLAAKIEDSRKPAELCFIKTPEEIADLYSMASFGTCMASNRDGIWGAIHKKGLHPCSIFGYHPHVRACYIKGKNGIRARTFLYTCEDGKEYSGRMYGDGPTSVKLLSNTLREQGIVPLKDTGQGSNRRDNSGLYWRDLEFKVPGIAYNADWLLLVPYFDNFRGEPIVTFDKDTHEFTVKTCAYPPPPGRPKSNIPAYEGTPTGYVFASNVCGSGITCCYCGRAIKPGTDYATLADQDTGNQYCGSKCMAITGRVIATTGEGRRVIKCTSECTKDALTGYWFTTPQAIIENGGAILQMDPLTLSEEDDQYSVNIFKSKISQYGFASEACRNMYDKVADIKIKPFSTNFRLTKRPRQIEFDPATFSGITIKGDIRDVFEDANLINDPNFGYPIHEKWPTVTSIDLANAYDGLGNVYNIRADFIFDQEAA